jgi:hypothetical protein
MATLQTIPLPAPALDAARRTLRIIFEPLLDKPVHFITIATLVKGRDHLLALAVRQFRDEFIQSLLKFAMLHWAP